MEASRVRALLAAVQSGELDLDAAFDQLNRPAAESLGFANAAAASCLRHPTCSGGVGSAAEIRDLAGSIPLGEG